MWEAYKIEQIEEYVRLRNLGSNPYNFVNKIHALITRADPNSGHMETQKKAMRDLEQLSLKNWTSGLYVKKFVNHYVYLTTIAGNTFNKEIGEKLFHKLPGPLGLEIHTKWNELPEVKNNPTSLWTITQRAQFIIKILEEKCVDLQIQKQLKQTDYKFCSEIYTPQTYGSNNKRKNNYKKYKKINQKKYFLRKSNKRKPYLDEKRHVRKFKPERNYKNKLSCFVCNSTDHLARTCPKRQNNHEKNSILIECVNEDLIPVDENISDNESIYSIISIDETVPIQKNNTDYNTINEFSKEKIGNEDTTSDDEYELMNTENSLCTHKWKKHIGSDSVSCFICKFFPHKDLRAKCETCF